MIKFFRRIRQRLLRENKFSQYLIYAIGEIILVVIGILIALQINSWNDFNMERKNEQLILQNFRKNLNADYQLFERFHNNVTLASKSVDSILYMVNNPKEFNFLSFSLGIEKILSNTYFQSTSSTFDQAISTGTIDLIQNDSLRSELLNYYKISKLNFEDNRILETNNDFVFPVIFSEIAPTKSVAYALTGINTKLEELDVPSLATNTDFNTWLLFKKVAYDRQSKNYMLLQEKVVAIIELIDKNLN